MTNHWTPPSHRRPKLDLAALGIPAGRYILPDPTDFLLTPEGTNEGAARIHDYLNRKTGHDTLQPAELDFVRQHFLNAAEEQRQRAITHFESKVPRRYISARPTDLATAWAHTVTTTPETTRSLLIIGPTGTGKTHYAYSVLRALAETGAALKWAAYTAADLYAQLRPRTGRDSEATFEQIVGADVLFVDDLAAAKLTEWTEEVTYRLINHRYEQCKPGIFTSNVPPAQLRDALGERIASRLTEMCERVALKGDDRRKGMAA
ncbi:ATP-binding protein [Streptomyces antibioticus]|uniref:ATP-binding protein n=1 Tax=Streptomyces antibioticus TaxID=1890 RepID=A0AAE6YCW4_STRAT|nr:ATP-binding protein [Streptomyces antibioticus]QIT47598.1 ATP-binding protein [Streptomyces antibioticus]